MTNVGIVILIVLFIIILIYVFKPTCVKRQLTWLTKYKEIKHIDANIYLSDWNQSVNKTELQDKKIKHVINISGYDKTQKEQNLYRSLGIKSHWLHAIDKPSFDILPMIKKSKIILDGIPSTENILIHCWAGVSRSATLVIARIMDKKNMDVDSAINFVRSKSCVINPNSGFLKTLRNL